MSVVSFFTPTAIHLSAGARPLPNRLSSRVAQGGPQPALAYLIEQP